MKYFLDCGDTECDCNNMKVVEIECADDKFILRVECNFCGSVTAYDLWSIWDERGGEA